MIVDVPAPAIRLLRSAKQRFELDCHLVLAGMGIDPSSTEVQLDIDRGVVIFTSEREADGAAGRLDSDS